MFLVFVKVERGSKSEVAVGCVEVAFCLQPGFVLVVVLVESTASRFYEFLRTVEGSRPVKLASCAMSASRSPAPSDMSGQ